MNKELKELMRRAECQGWRVDVGNHHKWYAPDGRTIVVTGSSESDHRALHNTKARLRRAGFRDN